jgi:hypothetical protein
MRLEFLPSRFSGPLKRHAAGHFNSLSIDPPILVRKKRCDHGSDIIGHSCTSQSSHLRHTLIDFGVVAYHAAAEVGLDRAGSEYIRGNST